MPKHRTCIEGQEFAAKKTEIDPESRRFDLIMENVQWDMATNPTFFPSLNGTSLRIIKTRPGAAGLPGLNIYFRVDNPDDTCTLLWVEEASDQSPQSPLG